MATQTPQPGDSRSKSSETTNNSSNYLLTGTQQLRRHHSFHRDTANAATANIPEDELLKIVLETRCSKNFKQYAIGY